MRKTTFSRWLLSLTFAPFLVANAAELHPHCASSSQELMRIYTKAPEYPHHARRYCVEGHVRIRFTVDADGLTRDIEVIESTPAGWFDRSAQVVEAWRFLPSCHNGQPFAHSVVQEIQFDIEQIDSDHCPEIPDIKVGELLTEISSWYALLAIATMEGSLPDSREEIAASSGQFQGDLAKVEAFHLQAIDRILAMVDDMANVHDGRLLVVQDAEETDEDDQSLETMGEWLTEIKALWQVLLERYNHHADQLLAELQQLGRETELDQAALELLVMPFLGDFRSEDDPFRVLLETQIKDIDQAIDVVALHGQDGDLWTTSGPGQEELSALIDRILERAIKFQKQSRQQLEGLRVYL